MAKRILLWIGYYIVSSFISFIFWGSGGGSRVPAAIFYSWAYLFAYLHRYNPIGLLLSYLFYLCILFLISLFVFYRKKTRNYLALGGFYLLGSIVSFIVVGRAGQESVFEYVTYFIQSALFVVVFFLLDRKMIMGHVNQR